jgi:hypothetical protein
MGKVERREGRRRASSASASGKKDVGRRNHGKGEVLRRGEVKPGQEEEIEEERHNERGQGLVRKSEKE